MSEERPAFGFGHPSPMRVVFYNSAAYPSYLRVAGLWVSQNESADRRVRNHRIAFCELYPELSAVRKKLHYVAFERVVRAAGVSCCRLDYPCVTASGLVQTSVEPGVYPAGNSFRQGDFD